LPQRSPGCIILPRLNDPLKVHAKEDPSAAQKVLLFRVRNDRLIAALNTVPNAIFLTFSDVLARLTQRILFRKLHFPHAETLASLLLRDRLTDILPVFLGSWHNENVNYVERLFRSILTQARMKPTLSYHA
jgi:hypothetical protein